MVRRTKDKIGHCPKLIRSCMQVKIQFDRRYFCSSHKQQCLFSKLWAKNIKIFLHMPLEFSNYAAKHFFFTISHGFMIIIHTLDSTFRAFFYTSRERPINSANDFLSNLEFIFIKVKKGKRWNKNTLRQSDLLIESPS